MKKRKKKKIKQRNPVVEEMIKNPRKSGKHHDRERDIRKGASRKPKHKKSLDE